MCMMGAGKVERIQGERERGRERRREVVGGERDRKPPKPELMSR